MSLPDEVRAERTASGDLRYASTNKVAEPEIRNFIGSLDSRGANQDVFITTSSFQPAAEKTAARYRHDRIVLIDGIKLTSLMLTYGIAVHKTREFTLFEIDEDFLKTISNRLAYRH